MTTAAAANAKQEEHALRYVDKWRILSRLGEGSFGTVHAVTVKRAQEKVGGLFAV
jgi:hypothetical protein